MLKRLLTTLADWVGDRSLKDAIRAELRRQGYAVHGARIRDVNLAAISRAGWVQVYRFTVESWPISANDDREPLTLLGLSRNDGRKSRTEVLLTTDEAEWRGKLDEWSEGLLTRR
jgi:hypothetical protein